MNEPTLEELMQEAPFSLPVPENRLERVRAFARELAVGAINDYWRDPFYARQTEQGANFWATSYRDSLLGSYVLYKWGDRAPSRSPLVGSGYLRYVPPQSVPAADGSPGALTTGNEYYLTEKAYALVEEAPLSPIFISYRNQESATFALLLLARMKAAGLNPFLDVSSLRLGDKWDARLVDEVLRADYVVCLLGPRTLESDYVRKEITLAQEAGKRIIPVYHGGFAVDGLLARYGDEAVARVLEASQAIVVKEESTSEYHRVMVEVLNFFGVTP